LLSRCPRVDARTRPLQFLHRRRLKRRAAPLAVTQATPHWGAGHEREAAALARRPCSGCHGSASGGDGAADGVAYESALIGDGANGPSPTHRPRADAKGPAPMTAIETRASTDVRGQDERPSSPSPVAGDFYGIASTLSVEDQAIVQRVRAFMEAEVA